MFCVYVDGEQPSKTPPLKFNIHLSPYQAMKSKMRKIGRLKDYTTGKVGKLESKSGEFFIAFQHKDGEAIFLSQELQDLIDKTQEVAKIKKVLVPLIDKCKLGQMVDSDTFVAYMGGDFTWA